MTDPIAARLESAMANAALPAEIRQRGQQLMAQLARPPRILVLGLPGSGKTGLINMLLGAPLMPALPGVLVSELCQGETLRAHVELADGSTKIIAGRAEPQGLPDAAVRVIQEMPDAGLADWSFMELGLTGASVDEHELVRWAARRADLAIWCTQGFDAAEQALWAGVPDHLKDHGFLALTKADQLFLRGDLSARIADLQPVVAEEFLCLYPLATMQAIAARRGGDGIDAALWQSSGGAMLFQRIRQEIEQARLADLDQAAVFLDRCGIAPLADAPVAPSRPAIAPVAEPKAPLAAAPARAPAAGRETTAIETALGLLHDCASELLDAPETASAAAGDRILDRCNQVARDLVAVLSQDRHPSDAVADCRDSAIEGEEMLMLLQLERDEDAAVDAVTVLFQLKKEFAERIAR